MSRGRRFLDDAFTLSFPHNSSSWLLIFFFLIHLPSLSLFFLFLTSFSSFGGLLVPFLCLLLGLVSFPCFLFPFPSTRLAGRGQIIHSLFTFLSLFFSKPKAFSLVQKGKKKLIRNTSDSRPAALRRDLPILPSKWVPIFLPLLSPTLQRSSSVLQIVSQTSSWQVSGLAHCTLLS